MNILSLINLLLLPGLILFLLTKKKNNLQSIDNIILFVPFSIGAAYFSTWILILLNKLDSILLLLLIELIFVIVIYFILSFFLIKDTQFIKSNKFPNFKYLYLNEYDKYSLWYILSFLLVAIFLFQSFRFSYLFAYIHWDPLYQIVLLCKKILAEGGINLPFKIFWDKEVSKGELYLDHFVSYSVYYHPFNYTGHIYFGIFNNSEFSEFARIQNFIISAFIILTFARLLTLMQSLSRYYFYLLILISCSTFILFSHIFQAELYLFYFSLLFVLTREFIRIEKNKIFFIFSGLFLSFALLSKPLAYSLLFYLFIDFILDKKNRNQNLITFVFLFPFIAFLFVINYFFEGQEFLKLGISLQAIKFTLERLIQLPFFNTNDYDANSWGWLVNIFFILGLIPILVKIKKTVSFSFEKLNFIHKEYYHIFLIIYSSGLFFSIIFFTSYGINMMYLFSNYMVVIVPSVLVITAFGFQNVLKLCKNTNNLIKLKMIFLILFLSSFQYVFLSPKNPWLWKKDIKFYSFEETLKIVNPKWLELVDFIKQKNIKSFEKILGIPPYQLSYFAENLIFFDDLNFNKIKNLDNSNEIFKTLKQENIKYISLMNNQFHVGNIILNAKFKGHKVFFNELFHQNDSKFVKKNF